jgi:hypothetical protein
MEDDQKRNLLAPLDKKNLMGCNLNYEQKEGRMKKGLVPLIAILVVGLLVAGLTANRENEAKLTFQERIKKLEGELALLKMELRKGEGLEPEVVIDDPVKKSSPRVFLNGTRGWQEDGTSMWTAMNYNVGINTLIAPSCELDINGDMRINGGINDGGSWGLANQVLVSDGVGGVAWAGSPGGSADYIWNQDTAAQTPANFWISGTGRADYSLIGISSVASDFGVLGWAAATTGNGQGVYGTSDSDVGFGGVFIGGNAGTWWSITGEDAGVAGTGLAYGVMGWGHDNTSGGEGIGVLGVGNPQAAATVRIAYGSGVCGYSPTDIGVYGATDEATAFGVYGRNAVAGGDGVFGVGNAQASASYWGGAGVSGSSSDLGVFGYGDATSASWGVLGWSGATNGYGVYAYATGATAFGARAHNTNASGTAVVGSGNNVAGIYLTAGSGGSFASNNVGSFSYGRNATDALGALDATYLASLMTQPVGHDCGMCGDGYQWGIMGSGQNATAFGVGVTGLGGGTSNINYITGVGGAFTGATGVLAYGEAGNGAYIEVLDAITYWALQVGDGIAGNLQEGISDGWYAYKSSSKGAIAVPTPISVTEDVYASGTARIANGSATIPYPYPFSDLISSEIPVVITVTPTEECNGLYISETRADGFAVKEMNGGRSNASFNWIAVGREKGKEVADYRENKIGAKPKTVKASYVQNKEDVIQTKEMKLKTMEAGDKQLKPRRDETGKADSNKKNAKVK